MILELKERLLELREKLIYYDGQLLSKESIELAARASVYLGDEMQSDDRDIVREEIRKRKPEIKENEDPSVPRDFFNICKRDECSKAEELVDLSDEDKINAGLFAVIQGLAQAVKENRLNADEITADVQQTIKNDDSGT